MDENLSMYELIKQQAEKTPFYTAVYYQRKKINFKKFIKLIDKTADILTNVLNVKRDDIVMVSQPNIPQVLILIYALNKIGAVVNLVHPFTPYNQIRNIMKNTNTKLAFIFEQRVAKEVENYREISNNIIVTRIEDYLPLFKKFIYHTFLNRQIRKKLGKFRNSFKGFTYLYELKPTKKGSPTVVDKKDEIQVLLHSGSTTGDPKTICLADRNFNFIANHADEALSIDHTTLKNGGMLSILPSFHGFGFAMTMHTPLTNGYSCVLIPKYSAKEVVDAIKHIKVNLICGVPTLYENLLQNKEFRNCKRLKYMHVGWSGGDSCNPETLNDFKTVMKNNGSRAQLFEGYGLTEAIAVNSINTYKHNKLGSIGYPLTRVDFKIVNDSGKEVKRGEIGEITIKGGANMICYFNDEKSTKEAVKDGWIYTGDLGYMDEDGFIFYTQRKKRVIKVSGVGVFPTEIEKLIDTINGVSACCAIEIPDARLQHAVKVFVVAKYYDEQGMINTILDTCRKYLIRWAVPKEIEFVNELPKTLLGKVDFNSLQKQENIKRGIVDEK